jgi:hypothetical protein
MRFLQQNQSAPVELVPPVRPASATLAFVSPAGVALSSPSVTLDPVSRAIASVGDFSFTTGAGVGVVVPGRPYWLVNPNEGAALVRPSSVSGTTVTYQDTLGVSVTAACLLYGATLSATIPSSATTQVGQWYQLRWLVTPVTGQVSSYLEPASVCRTVFLPPMTPDVAARHAGYAFPSVAAGKRSEYWVGVAERASRRVIQRVMASGRMPYLVGDQSLLVDAGMAALRIELARDGLIPPGFDGTTFVDRMEEELKQQMEYALAGAYYDEQDDGKVDASDLRSPKTIRLCRT